MRESDKSGISICNRIKFLSENKHLCYFTLRELEQDKIKNIVSYLRRNKDKLKINPVHKHGEIVQYFMSEDFIIDNMLKKEFLARSIKL